MKAGIVLETERLTLRHWRLDESDREFFHQIMSDPVGRRFYPTQKTRSESDELLEKIVTREQENKLTWSVACLKETGQQLGFTGLCKVDFDVPFAPTVETGWQYHVDYWGNGYATEAATELLRHGFEDLDLPEIVAFAVPENEASTAVMGRIGMKPCPEETFIHPGVPDSKAHLKRHVLWRTTRHEWRKKH